MKAYQKSFNCLKEKGLNPVVPFLMLTDPSPEVFLERAKKLITAGVAGFEFGLPFSDPLFDGPVIQKAHQRVLAQGFKEEVMLEVLKELKATDSNIPLGIMSACNPVLQMKHSSLERLQSLVDSILIPDLPIFEDGLVEETKEVLFLAPIEREREYQDRVARRLQSFVGAYIYLSGYIGVTGKKANETQATLHNQIDFIRQNCDAPVVVGFGVQSKQNVVDMMSLGADAVIVGSKIVEMYEQKKDVAKFVEELIKG